MLRQVQKYTNITDEELKLWALAVKNIDTGKLNEIINGYIVNNDESNSLVMETWVEQAKKQEVTND